uniref:Uncharacterized protein n=1 Tax=Rhizophora mucronata TaxID=61149 RepID=A0A2P2NWK5_RHIMU
MVNLIEDFVWHFSIWPSSGIVLYIRTWKRKGTSLLCHAMYWLYMPCMLLLLNPA